MASDLMAGTMKAIIDRSGIDPALVEDVCVGTVLAPGGGATEMRAAAFVAGFPETTAVRTLNRQCSSGLQACVDVANQIKAGMIEVGLGCGVESMSTQYGYVFFFLLFFRDASKGYVICMHIELTKNRQPRRRH